MDYAKERHVKIVRHCVVWNPPRILALSASFYSFLRFPEYHLFDQTSLTPFAFPALCVQDPLCTPALRALGNMVSGQDAWADAVMVHNQFLPCLAAVLASQVQQQKQQQQQHAYAVDAPG